MAADEPAYVFFIVRGGELRVEMDHHMTGLFPLATWERLLGAGFAWERVDYPVSADGTPMWLWVRELWAVLDAGCPSTGSGRTGGGRCANRPYERG